MLSLTNTSNNESRKNTRDQTKMICTVKHGISSYSVDVRSNSYTISVCSILKKRHIISSNE